MGMRKVNIIYVVCPSLLLGITGLQEEYRPDDGICGGFRTSLLSVDCGTGA